MPGTPTQKKKVREHIPTYCLSAERNEVAWHYSQARPFRYINNPSQDWVVADCSAYISIVFHDAMHDLGIFLADPLGYKYRGIGNTASMEAWLRSNGTTVPRTHKLLVGDIARWGYGATAHTAIVRLAGTWSAAVLSSFGREAGPLPVHVDYRDDFVGMWRHPALA